MWRFAGRMNLLFPGGEFLGAQPQLEERLLVAVGTLLAASPPEHVRQAIHRGLQLRDLAAKLLAIQPRIRLTRSFDQRSHSYLGYALRIRGIIGDDEREFLVGIGEAAQAKHQFRAGDMLSGRSEPVADPKMKPVQFYKASGLKLIERAGGEAPAPPPFVGVPSELPVYRERSHRRLDAKTYAARCVSCIWGCRMPVEMIIDQWNPSQKKYRFETFCYGPKSCSLYRPGPTRKVPGRKGMSWEEEDWIDEEATAHRGDDE